MPLDRAHITRASAVMLVAYPALNLAFGALMVIDPQERFQLAPSLDPARAWLPLWAWGAMWLALAVLMAAAWRHGHRERYVFALGVNGAAWTSWGLLVEAAVFDQPNVTYTAGFLPWFVAAACYATLRSLRARERG